MSEKDYQCVVDALHQYSFTIKVDPVTERVPLFKTFSKTITFEGCEDVADDPDRTKIRRFYENDFNLVKSDDNQTINNGRLNPTTGLLEFYFTGSIFSRVYCGGECSNSGGYVSTETHFNTRPNLPNIGFLNFRLKSCFDSSLGCKVSKCLGRWGRFDSLNWGSNRIQEINKCIREANKQFYADVEAIGCENANEFCYEEPHLADPSNFDAYNYRTHREKELMSLGRTDVYKSTGSPFTQEIMDIHNFNLSL